MKVFVGLLLGILTKDGSLDNEKSIQKLSEVAAAYAVAGVCISNQIFFCFALGTNMNTPIGLVPR